MNEKEKEATIEAICDIPRPSGDDNPEQWLKYIQRNWLSAMAGIGYEPVETWYQGLLADLALGAPSRHPDFRSYMESWSGPGPTAYTLPEILSFVEYGSVVEKLNAFQQPNTWRGPTTRALVDTLEEVVAYRPQTFLRLLPKFLEAKRPFQYGVINGFKRIWDTTPQDGQEQLDWARAWAALVEFFEQLIALPGFWKEAVIADHDLTPNRDWIPSVISTFLRAGTSEDSKAYPPELLPRTWELIGTLLQNSEAVTNAKDDAMFQSVNSSKGKAVEALLSHALRACRLSDRATGGHARVWAEMSPTFDSELARCRNANFEFSTLMGAYIANLDYLERDWLRANVERIFPREFEGNCACALAGLAYAPATRPVYGMLRDSGVLDEPLRKNFSDRYAREKIIEKIALAYLWTDEELHSPRFSYFFESERVDDLEDASGLFWSVRNQKLSDAQVERVLSFLDRCVAWGQEGAQPPRKLFSSLSRLICYVGAVGEREKQWLLAIAPHVVVGHNADEFIEELDRLVEMNPPVISAVLHRVLDTYTPSFDFEGRLKSFLTRLVNHGQRVEFLSLADRLRHIPEIRELYLHLTP